MVFIIVSDSNGLTYYYPVLQIRNPMFFCGFGMGKKCGSGIREGNIPDHISESLETYFWEILKVFDADPDPG
jgi:hypothetical protein